MHLLTEYEFAVSVHYMVNSSYIYSHSYICFKCLSYVCMLLEPDAANFLLILALEVLFY